MSKLVALGMSGIWVQEVNHIWWYGIGLYSDQNAATSQTLSYNTLSKFTIKTQYYSLYYYATKFSSSKPQNSKFAQTDTDTEIHLSSKEQRAKSSEKNFDTRSLSLQPCQRPSFGDLISNFPTT